MSNTDTCQSSGYCTELTLNLSESQKDQLDCADLSVPILERNFFSNKDEERPPYKFECCDSRIERSLVHYAIILDVIFFCIIFLSLCDAESKFASGVLHFFQLVLATLYPPRNHEQENQHQSTLLHFNHRPRWLWQDKFNWKDDYESGENFPTVFR